MFFALNGKVPKRFNIYTNKLRNLEYLQVPKENISSEDFFKLGLLIIKKFPKYISSSGKTINGLLKNVTV